MSVYHPYPVRCRCGHSFTAQLADGVNAGRMPHIRQLILEGRFHRATCPSCQLEMTIEKEFTYTDFTRNSFYRVLPRQDRHRWREAAGRLEADVVMVPASLLTRGQKKLRVVCGLSELREKLLAEDAALDDRIVEALKVLAVSDHPIVLHEPRARVAFNGITETSVEYVASFDHADRAYRLAVPRWTAEGVLRDRNVLESWVNTAHGDGSIFREEGATWVNMWRWSPQPEGLATLRTIAQAIRAGEQVDLAKEEVSRMLDSLPTGRHLPSWAKEDLQILFTHAVANGLDDVQRRIIAIRFGKVIEDDWALNADRDDLPTLWKLLIALPRTHVEGNIAFDELNLAEGEGGGWYDPRSYDIYIGAHELGDREGFEDVIRHEIGHAVHEDRSVEIDRWLNRAFGWRMYSTSNAHIDAWVGEMGGWGNLDELQRSQVRGYLVEALGGGSSWNPGRAPLPPSGHPWWGAEFGPRLAYENTGANWYKNTDRWYRHGDRAFFLNYWYRSLMSVSITTLDLIMSMPSSYAAMSPFEFFAELYALYFDHDDARRAHIPADVIAWMDARLAQDVQQPAMPAPPAEPQPWDWIIRPNGAQRGHAGLAGEVE